SEDGDEPRHASRGHPHVVCEIVFVQSERAHVLDRLPIQAIEILVRRCQPGGLLLPPALEDVELRLLLLRAPTLRPPDTRTADKDVVAARVPLLAGLEGHLEADAAVGVRRRARAALHAVDERTGEIPIYVRGLQLTAGFLPLRRNPAAAH